MKAGPPRTFTIPSKGGRGPARIYFELFWGEARQGANSFGPTKKDKPVTAGLLDGLYLHIVPVLLEGLERGRSVWIGG